VKYTDYGGDGKTSDWVPADRGVSVLGRTLEKEQVGQWNAYWYLVEVPTDDEGSVGLRWMYGEFVRLTEERVSLRAAKAAGPKLVPDGMQARPIESEAEFVAALVQERGWEWDLDADSLQSYWSTDSNLGDLGVGRVQNPAMYGHPEDQAELWFFYRGPRGSWVFGPLAERGPTTRFLWEELTCSKLSIIPGGGAAGRLVWVELQANFNEYSESYDEDGEFLSDTTTTQEGTRGYAFYVSGDKGLLCVAFGVPLMTRVTVNADVQRESVLAVSFPEPGVLAVDQLTPTIEPMQKPWLGRHALGYEQAGTAR
jgi:hypothetical protein